MFAGGIMVRRLCDEDVVDSPRKAGMFSIAYNVLPYKWLVLKRSVRNGKGSTYHILAARLNQALQAPTHISKSDFDSEANPNSMHR